MDIDRVDWIRDGMINSLAYPRAAAAEFGVPVAVAADNLLMTGGTDSLADMVAATERGLLLTTLWYIRVVDPGVLLLTGLTRDGVYLVEDGQVTGAVNNFRFNESPLDLLTAGQPGRRQRGHASARMGRLGHQGGDAVAADPRLPHVVGQPGAIMRRCTIRLNGELGRLVALAPPEHGRINALVRQTCAKTLSLPPLPTELAVDGPADEAESVAVEFAEQFSVDVSSVGDDLRSRFTSRSVEPRSPSWC